MNPDVLQASASQISMTRVLFASVLNLLVVNSKATALFFFNQQKTLSERSKTGEMYS
jgi:hypothetical protein